MKTRIKAAAAIAFTMIVTPLAAAPLPEAKPDEVGFSQSGLDRMDAFFAREIAAKRVPGAVVAIARDGKLVHYKAYGQLDPVKGTPMPLDAIFALASMTKPMAAVGALTLMEQGRLPLQAKLADYYPAFADMKVGVVQEGGALQFEPQRRPILIHDLYRHTSGLMYGGRPDSASPVARLYPDGIAPAIEGDTQAFIERLTKLPLAHQPGTQFEYGFSIDVLGAVVEKVSEQRLGDYLSNNLWKPLGMVDATFAPTEAQRPRLARPFPNDPLTGKPQAIKLLDTPTRSDCGGACSFATIGDYIRFGQMLLNGGELDGVRILSPKTVHHMTSNHLGPEIKNTVANVEPHRAGFGFGLSVAVRVSEGLSAVPGNPGEFSWNGAFGTQFFCDPKERLVVVVGTASPGDLRKYYREQVQDIVYGAMVRQRMLTVHHLGKSQSERIVWLCEELEIPHDLKCYARDAKTILAPAEYKALHAIGAAPVITDGELQLAESGAIVEYITAKYGQGRLRPGPDDPGFAPFLYWFHFANGTLQAAMGRLMILNRLNLPEDNPMLLAMRGRVDRAFAAVEARCGETDYLAGNALTSADIMTVFSLTTMRYFLPYDLAPFPNIRAYLARIGARPAYQRAMAKGDPGMELLLS